MHLHGLVVPCGYLRCEGERDAPPREGQNATADVTALHLIVRHRGKREWRLQGIVCAAVHPVKPRLAALCPPSLSVLLSSASLSLTPSAALKHIDICGSAARLALRILCTPIISWS